MIRWLLNLGALTFLTACGVGVSLAAGGGAGTDESFGDTAAGAGRPIVTRRGIPDWHELQRRQALWAERVLVKPFLERTAGRPWQPAALDFVRQALVRLGPGPEIMLPAGVAERGQQLLATCDDPLVCYLAAPEGESAQPFVMRTDTYRRALTAALALPGPRALAWLIAKDLGHAQDGMVHADPDAPQAWKLAPVVLRDGSYAGDEERELFLEHLVGDTPGGPLRRLAHWNPEAFKPLAADAPGEPPADWLRLTVRGILETVAAGTEDQRAEFHEREAGEAHEKARRHRAAARGMFTRAWELHPQSPFAPAELIELVTALPEGSQLPGETPRLWFDRAVAARFDFHPAYLAMLDACHPGRTGSVEPILAFGQACRATGRMDTVVPEMFFAATATAADASGDWRRVFRERPEISRGMVELSQARVDEPGRQPSRPQNLAYLAVNAYLAGDLPTAARAVTGLPRGMLLDAGLDKLQQFHVKIEDFQEEIRLASDPTGEQVARGEALLARRRWTQAAGIFDGLRANCPEPWRERVERRWRLADFERRLEAGESVELSPSARDAAWQTEPPTVRFPAGLPAPAPTPELPPRLIYTLPLADELEVSAEVAPPPSDPAGCPLGLNFFLMTTRRDGLEDGGMSRRAEWIRCQLRRDPLSGGWMLGLKDGNQRPLTAELAVNVQARNTVRLRLQSSRVTLEWNGKAVFRDVSAPPKTNGYEEVILGQEGPPKASVRPEHLRVRRLLPVAPAPPVT